MSNLLLYLYGSCNAFFRFYIAYPIIVMSCYLSLLNRLYIVISAAVFATFWIIFNVSDQLLFFSPVATFYLPDDATAGFVITNITSALMGILIAMNVYVIRNSKHTCLLGVLLIITLLRLSGP
jgi:hypothetical protein